MKKLSASGAGLVALFLAFAPAQGQSLDKKIQNDKTISIKADDPLMADAMQRARATLPDFLKMLPNPPSSAQFMAVKIGLREKNNDNTEFVWIGDLRQNGDTFSGVIGNRVELLRSYRQGDTITFNKSDIVDWTYNDTTGRKGNFTSCVLLKHENSAEAEKVIARLKLDCSWLK